MNFGEANCPILEPYPRDALSFPPPTPTVDSAQPRELANASTIGDGLDIAESVENREVHAGISILRATLSNRNRLQNGTPNVRNRG